jgi:hypothetical protein
VTIMRDMWAKLQVSLIVNSHVLGHRIGAEATDQTASRIEHWRQREGDNG